MLTKSVAQDIYTLSPMQEGMYFHAILDDNSLAYFQQLSYRLHGTLRPELVERALEELFRRHDILRTTFVNETLNRTFQVVLKERIPDFNFQDIRYLGDEEKEEYLENFRIEDRERYFDLLKDVLIRVNIFQVNENEFEFIWSHHHILMDGWSIGILLREYFQIYTSLSSEKPLALAAPVPYKSYIKWLEQQDKDEAKNFWYDFLKGYDQKASVPRSRKTLKPPSLAQYRFELNGETTKKIHQLVNDQKVTLSTFLQAIWGILLSKYNDQRDVVFGAVVSGRPAEVEGIESMIGLFINTIPIRISYDESETFSALIQRAHERAVSSSGYHHFPLADIQAGSTLKQNLIDHIFVFNNYPIEAQIDEAENASSGGEDEIDLELSGVGEFDLTNYDFNIKLICHHEIMLSIDYNPDVFEGELIKRMVQHFQQVVDQILTDVDVIVDDIDLLSTEEKEQLKGYGTSAGEYPIGTLHEVFEQVAQAHPEKCAVATKENAYTYQELDQKANQLARELSQDFDVKHGDPVVLMTDRSYESLVGMLAIFKIGAIYVPVDPVYSSERVRQIFEDSNPQLVLTDTANLLKLSTFKGKVFALDLQLDVMTSDTSTFQGQVDPKDMAYVIFTSGSTGKPKGVTITHESIVDRILYHNEYLNNTSEDVVLHMASIGFDAALVEIFMAFLSGGKLVVADSTIKNNMDLLLEMLDEHAVTLAIMPPAYLNALNKYPLASVTKIISTGEAALLEESAFYAETKSFYNGYGPTETCVGASFYQVNPDRKEEYSRFGGIPIGKPFANTEIKLLDSKGNLVPVGVQGEICIAGVGLSTGYLNDPELTAEKFALGPNAEKLYRSGDYGKWNEEGNLLFLGRIDEQIQIRGIRVEPQEIQQAILRHPSVKDAVVIAEKITEEDKVLVSYMVTTEEVSNEKMRDHLSTLIPDYMIPAYFLEVDSLSFNANGKLDKAKLPSIHDAALVRLTDQYQAAETKMEKALTEIWEKVLGKERIGVLDNFFELGGHSLKATRILAQVYKVLDIRMSVSSLFNHPTIQTLAVELEKAGKKEFKAISKVPEAPDYPLSHAQRRLWVIDQLDEKARLIYNIPSAYEFMGDLNLEALERAFTALVDRHESLRTVFREKGDEPRQVILPIEASGFHLAYEDLRSEQMSDEDVKARIQEERMQPFDLSSDCLFRAKLFQVADDKHVLFFTLHHIIADGWSMQVLVNEITTLYDAFDAQKENPLAPLSIQYKDFIVWQQEEMNESMEQAKAYWSDSLGGQLPILELPYDFQRPAVQNFKAQRVRRVLNEELTSKLKAFCQTHDATLFMGLMTSIYALLSRYTGQQDLLLGTPVSGRQHASLENQIGFFINTLVIRNKLAQDDTITSLLHKVKDSVLGAFENQMYPFDLLVDELDVPRDLSRNPIFDVMVVLQNVDYNDGHVSVEPEQAPVDIAVRGLDTGEVFNDFDLSFTFSEIGDQIALAVDFSTNLFLPQTIDRMLLHYEQLLEMMLVQEEVEIKKINYLSEAETDVLLNGFNQQPVALPSYSFIEVFEEQVSKTPNAVAVSCNGRSLTYNELNEQTNKLAHYLRSTSSLEKESTVAVILERTEWLIISMLAIFKNGYTYLPIDPEYPKERVDYLLNDSEVQLILCDGNREGLFEHIDLPTVDLLQLDWDSMHETGNPEDKGISSGNQLAYILYTSGSTGLPKGAMIEHEGMMNHLYAKVHDLELNGDSIVAQTAVQSFDISIWQALVALLLGGKTVIYNEDLTELIKKYDEDKVTILEVVPSYLSHIMDVLAEENTSGLFESMKYLVITGETVKYDLVNKWLDQFPAIPVMNAYGPTEASDDITHYVMREKLKVSNVPIGHPVQNMNIYILDENHHLCPIGVKGEICVSGIGVGRGYKNNEQRTAQAFLADPILEGRRMYKTGDVGRFNDSGEVEFFGRKDHQVKIRGHRIELAEIENAIADYHEVKDIVVLARKSQEVDAYLSAFFIAENGEIDAELLRTFLMDKIPEYMVPSYFVQMDEFPLTSNGKVDRKSFPTEEVSMLKKKSDGNDLPRNSRERLILRVWKKVLGNEEIGMEDNFFELGGHSLKATRIISILAKEMSVKLSLVDIFRNPTIRSFSKVVFNAKKEQFTPIPVAPQQPDYPVSNAQRRLWIIDQLDEQAGVAYNIPSAFTINGPIDIEALKSAFEHVVNRHESLRTLFIEVDGEPRQKIVPIADASLPLEVINLEKEVDGLQAARKIVEEDTAKAFILSEDLPIRIKVMELAPERHVIYFAIHHIIADGWSIQVIMDELLLHYQSLLNSEEAPLDPLPIQYKDYTLWQNAKLEESGTLDHQNYWSTKLQAPLTPINLPADRSRPAVKSFEGGVIFQLISDELIEKLKVLCNQEDTSLFVGLVSCIHSLIYHYTGVEDQVIGSPIAGREHTDLESQVGFYVNTLALRSQLQSESSFSSLLRTVKSTVLEAFEHQNYPFDVLVDELDLPRDMGRNPVFDIMVVLENEFLTNDSELFSQELSDQLQMDEFDRSRVSSKFDLTFNFRDADNHFAIVIEYSKDLFDSERIEQLIAHFITLLESVVETPELSICDLNILPNDELQLVTEKYNDTTEHYPSQKLTSAFENWVVSDPEAPAVTFQSQTFTYAGLNEYINQLANLLREDYNVGPGAHVGMLLDKSAECAICMLAIAKAGACYVPLDPQLPDNRLKFIAEDSRIVVLMTTSSLAKRIPDATHANVILDELNLDAYDRSNPEVVIAPLDPCYIVYTSGSTGIPKGVVIPFRSLENFIHWTLSTLELPQKMSMMQFASFSFDMAIYDTYLTLCSGGHLIVTSKEDQSDFHQLKNMIIKDRIEILSFPYAVMSQFFLEFADESWEGHSLDHVISTGEQLMITPPIRSFFDQNPSVTLHNFYGPAETNVVTNLVLHPVPEDTVRASIGKPISNVQIYVLDAHQNPVPVGVPGEIYIGGANNATGYLNRPDLTKQKFVKSPFGDELLYRSGDLGRWNRNGELEYLQRIDKQVKINGNRVEPDEIKKVILKHPKLKEVAVLVKKNTFGEVTLVAYFTTIDDMDLNEVRDYLKGELPGYMIPSFLVPIEKMPLNPNGKVDNAKLPDIDEISFSNQDFKAPTNKLEEDLVAIWEEILDRKPISINDNFFEIGGHSLKGTRMLAKIHRDLNLKISLRDVFAHPTIEMLANRIELINWSREATPVQEETDALKEITI